MVRRAPWFRGVVAVSARSAVLRTRSRDLRAARVKRYRRRVRNGSAVLRIEVGDYCGLVSVLLDAGWLGDMT